jgi:hypothetical protein
MNQPHGKQQRQTTVRLQDGEQIVLSVSEAERVFNELWLLGDRMKGAITAAAKLKRVETWRLFHGDDVLNAEETTALREALRRAAPDY